MRCIYCGASDANHICLKAKQAYLANKLLEVSSANLVSCSYASLFIFTVISGKDNENQS